MLMAELLESFSLYSWVSVCSGSAVYKAPALSESVCRVLESLGSWIPVQWLWGWTQVVINITYCCLGIWRSHTQVPRLLGTFVSVLLPLGRHPNLRDWRYSQSSVQKDIRLPHLYGLASICKLWKAWKRKTLIHQIYGFNNCCHFRQQGSLGIIFLCMPR